MNAFPKTMRSPCLASRRNGFDPNEERPPDRELRRLRGLSADAGVSCNACLTKQGIKTRSWGNFDLGMFPHNRARHELSPENDL
jgi:hypothetical protein